jgi:serine/threonine-protein kinase
MYRANDQIGPYTLIRRLGQGASGLVWLAERRGALLTTEVALKLPFDEEANLESINREAQVWRAATGHPNVLPVIEADMYEGQVIIVSEYASGGTLKDWLDRNGGQAPSCEAAVHMMAGILSGLEHLHEKGLVHCDLKPSNVLLQGDIPRITDFGVSRVLRATVHTKHLSGTPAYMPPEAIDGHLSKLSDLWAAGVILYVMLSGRLPFPQQSMGPLMLALKEQEPDPLPPTVPTALKRIIKQALQKNPNERYASARDMRQALLSASLEVEECIEVEEPEPKLKTGTMMLPKLESIMESVASVPEWLAKTNPRDGAELVWVPPGEFTMGSDDGERREKPVHRVVLDGYWIYKMPVTVGQYRLFCAATGRALRHAPPWGWQEEHPIVNVSWEYATAYAQWAGASLPTEAEWEKAARGTDSRTFPWGDEWDRAKCCNSVDIRRSSVSFVGTYRDGSSPYGVLDMAGNVWEWTADWYEETYYAFSPENNPTGPFFGTHRVLRGGSWGNDIVHDYRTSTRVVCEPVVRGGSIGFRCVLREPKEGGGPK